MRLLYITSLSGKRINGFMRSAIYAAKRTGFDFVMACNTGMADTEGYKKDCLDYGIEIKHIDFDRNPFALVNRKAYRQLLDLLGTEHFDLLHCNTPIGGLLGRICAKKVGIKSVIYEAHGFHFWRGSPMKNWIIYYPIEKWLANYTDVLVTITKDDFRIAQRMKAKRKEYIHGVGVDLEMFSRRETGDRNIDLRGRLGIPQDAKVLLSVGELNSNKNHSIVFEALRTLNRNDIHYVICGDGVLRNAYEKYLSKQGLSKTIHLVGFQNDIREYYRMADLFVFPSLREGIPGAVLEAIGTGVPVIASDIRGIKDIIKSEKCRFNPKSVKQVAEKIAWGIEKKDDDNLIEENISNIQMYSFDTVVEELSAIYMKYKK